MLRARIFPLHIVSEICAASSPNSTESAPQHSIAAGVFQSTCITVSYRPGSGIEFDRLHDSATRLEVLIDRC